MKSTMELKMPDIESQTADHQLSGKSRDMHNAILSLREELEAIDSYNLRAEVCSNKEFRKILLHNRDEEKEHACMLLEWMRRNDPKLADELKNCLFTKKSIAKS
ncbi:MAG: ferritin [Gallionellaceae bacterium]|nr:ferritin [Gallionellaceae bacterium]